MLRRLLRRNWHDREQAVSRNCLASSAKECEQATRVDTDRWYARASYAIAFSALETFAPSMRVQSRVKIWLFARSIMARTSGSIRVSLMCTLLLQRESWRLGSKIAGGRKNIRIDITVGRRLGNTYSVDP